MNAVFGNSSTCSLARVFDANYIYEAQCEYLYNRRKYTRSRWHHKNNMTDEQLKIKKLMDNGCKSTKYYYSLDRIKWQLDNGYEYLFNFYMKDNRIVVAFGYNPSEPTFDNCPLITDTISFTDHFRIYGFHPVAEIYTTAVMKGTDTIYWAQPYFVRFRQRRANMLSFNYIKSATNLINNIEVETDLFKIYTSNKIITKGVLDEIQFHRRLDARYNEVVQRAFKNKTI